jgi:hypothetical protein
VAERVLVRPPEGERQKLEREPNPERGWWVVAVAGLVLGAIGWLDVLLLWIPPHFGRGEWEFGTVSATFDALPLATVGLALALAGAVALGWSLRIQVAGWFAAVVSVLLLAALVLFLLDVPLAWKGVGAVNRPPLMRAMGKTFVLAIGYIAMYAVTGWWVLRRVSRPPRAQRSTT